jgi:hypothetical protein
MESIFNCTATYVRDHKDVNIYTVGPACLIKDNKLSCNIFIVSNKYILKTGSSIHHVI